MARLYASTSVWHQAVQSTDNLAGHNPAVWLTQTCYATDIRIRWAIPCTLRPLADVEHGVAQIHCVLCLCTELPEGHGCQEGHGDRSAASPGQVLGSDYSTLFFLASPRPPKAHWPRIDIAHESAAQAAVKATTRF